MLTWGSSPPPGKTKNQETEKRERPSLNHQLSTLNQTILVMACIEARGLRKVYGTTVALEGIDLHVGEVVQRAPQDH